MRYFKAILLLTIITIFFTKIKAQTAADNLSAKIGFWEVPYEKRSVIGDSVIWIAPIDIFYYDGTYITMRWNNWSWSPYSPDGFFKFKTQWNGDTLMYLSPFNGWEQVALYRNNTYTSNITRVYNRSHHWQFRKITKAQIIETDKAVLTRRKLFDYQE
jgi:hypothetical protein